MQEGKNMLVQFSTKHEKHQEPQMQIILIYNRGINTYQQNSNLQGGVHVICIQPWFFSIGRLHFGQGLELASILTIETSTFSIS